MHRTATDAQKDVSRCYGWGAEQGGIGNNKFTEAAVYHDCTLLAGREDSARREERQEAARSVPQVPTSPRPFHLGKSGTWQLPLWPEAPPCGR